MNDYKFLHNGRHTRCAETIVTFNSNGEPTGSSNKSYIPTESEYKACKLIRSAVMPTAKQIRHSGFKRLNKSVIASGRVLCDS